jgi:hypothetical protein
VLDAWGATSGSARADLDAELAAAATAATTRVGDELRTLLAEGPAAQRVTPLELVRAAVAEPTALLAAAGVPPVRRDDFEARALPEDRYGLAPRTFADLGGANLGAAQLEWGLAKAAALRANSG